MLNKLRRPWALFALLATAFLIGFGGAAIADARTSAEPRPSATVRVSGDTARVIVTVYPKCNPGCPTSYLYSYLVGVAGAVPTVHTSVRTVDTLLITPRVAVVGQTDITPMKGTVKGTALRVTWSIPAYVPPPILDSVKAKVDTSNQLVMSFYVLPMYVQGDTAWRPGSQRPWVLVPRDVQGNVSLTMYEGDSTMTVTMVRLPDGRLVRPYGGDFAYTANPNPAFFRKHVVGSENDTMYVVALPCNCVRPPDGYGRPRLHQFNGTLGYAFPSMDGRWLPGVAQ